MPKLSNNQKQFHAAVAKGRNLKSNSDLELQVKSCNHYEEIQGIIKCDPCQEPGAEEVNCLFKNFRAFRAQKKGLKFGYYFPDAIQERSPLTHLSNRFNKNKPYDQADRSYLNGKLRGILKETIAQDQPVGKSRGKSKAGVLRSGFEGYRHVCDICLTSIFNHHYFCPACAIDICMHCHDNWKQVKKDSSKTACHGGLSHSPQVFILAKKYSEQVIDVVMEELEAADDGAGEVQMENEAGAQKPDQGSGSQNKYAHLEDVAMAEATDRSLPITIADATKMTTKQFQEIWQDRDPLLVKNCMDASKVSWDPKYFSEQYGDQEIEVIDCKNGSKHHSTAKEFFDSYESEDKLSAYCDKLGTSKVIKIKNWPPKEDFRHVFKDLHDDYMHNVLPAKEYCSDNGYYNVSNRLPEEYMPPDLGPKMFISQGSDPEIKSCTKLHCGMADAVNVMCFSKNKTAAAQWEIFLSKDLPNLRTFVHQLNKKKQRNVTLDPVLSESSYLDGNDLRQLERETGAKPFRFYQKPGDAVFVPAGCAHQVQNITGSIKCAYDFLSPETMGESSIVTSQFQDIKLEDKFQLKTTALYAWKSL